MKQFIAATLLVALLIPCVAHADAKADGYSFMPDGSFKPGIYVAVRDAKAYSDADTTTLWRQYKFKKGTQIKVYAAGTNSFKPGHGDWLNLAEGVACNKEAFPKGFNGIFLGVRTKDFKRIGDAPPCN